MTEVVILGSGNVAKHLIDAFSSQDAIKIVQLVSRNKTALKGYEKNLDCTTDFLNIKEVDVYIIAVSDDAIVSVAERLKDKKGLIVHTSGSISMQVLSNYKHYGVFYPLQTFSKEREINFKTVPICLEASSKNELSLLKKIAGKISDQIYEINSVQRNWLHLAAVFTNNFTNHLYHIGSQICKENQVPFEILKPLIHETADKIDILSPYDAQTGPARRDDSQTLNQQKKQLNNLEYQKIYELLTQSIQKTYGKKL